MDRRPSARARPPATAARGPRTARRAGDGAAKAGTRPSRERGPAVRAASEPPARDPLAAILQAAGELLDEVGAEGLNTTAVARRAGVSTATLYRHFPDKRAVLHAVVQSVHTERALAVGRYYERFVTEADWRAPLSDLLMDMYRMRVGRPGGRSTRRALQTSPELWQWDQQQNEELARAFAAAMRRRRPALSRARAQRIALVIVTATVALLDLACLDERRARSLLEEAISMRTAYLAPYLD
ncbi:MAG: TetR family transcriptional regulator [Burkholderiales bacterium]|jgi:AcrR family transcriptional regulator|nr:TetR family transcriptional regulator [Burkholderiales bacterium]MCZ8105822.1 TetR family transcriptional regulator [Burkholderiales bacterium]